MKMELSNERQLILELKAKMSDIGEVRSSNMELIDQLQKAKIAVEKLTNFRDKQKFQLTVRSNFDSIFFLNCYFRKCGMN